MSVDILGHISKFRPLDDVENENAYFRTRVPWVAPQAYLNIVYKGAPDDVLSQVAEKLDFPPTITCALRRCNGAILFSGNLSLYGVVEPGRLLNRKDPFSLPPFNIESENRGYRLSERFLTIGGYPFDGSKVCVDRTDERIYLFPPKDRTKASVSWTGFEIWLNSEMERLAQLFREDGRSIGDDSETVPKKVWVT